MASPRPSFSRYALRLFGRPTSPRKRSPFLGLQPGRNQDDDVDTWERPVYIYGTNHVEPLGRPRLHGCVRLSPGDVAELADSIDIGCRVVITE